MYIRKPKIHIQRECEKIKEYEKEKAKLENLTPQEYEQKIKDIAKKLNV